MNQQNKLTCVQRGWGSELEKDFKKYCLNYENTNYAVGHPGAFGLSIPKNKKEDFISYMDKNLPLMSNEPIYFVDYIFQGENFEKETIF